MYQLCIFSPAKEENISEYTRYEVLEPHTITCCQNQELLYDYLKKQTCHILVIDALFGEDILKEVISHLEAYPSIKIVVALNKGDAIPLEYGMNPIRYLHKENLEYVSNTINSLLKELDQQYLYLPIQVDQKIKVLKKEDIYYIESSRNYINIHCKEDVYKVRMTLKEVSSYLNENFVSTVKGIIINIRWIKEIDKKERKITMNDDRIIPISRSRFTQLNTKVED